MNECYVAESYLDATCLEIASRRSAKDEASLAGTALANWSKLARRVTLSAASKVLLSRRAVLVAFERSTAERKVEAFALNLSIQAADEDALRVLTEFFAVILSLGLPCPNEIKPFFSYFIIIFCKFF